MKKFIWFIVRIVFAPRNMKVSYFKGLYYNFWGGFTSDQVGLYDLNKDNKNSYLSEFDWYKSRKINGNDGKLLNNKLVFSNIIKDYVKVPDIYFIKENNKYYFGNYEACSIREGIKIIKDSGFVFLKPISKGKGIGVHRIDYRKKQFYLDMVRVSREVIENILETKNNYFVSKGIKQAKYLDDIYDKTTNTVRIITVRDDDEIKVLYAVQRFGDFNSIPVDNGSKGGLVSKIYLETGMLSEARSIKNKNIYRVHPDSGSDIEGVVIPRFREICDKLLMVMNRLDNIKFIAWDILVTDNDFYVIEANNSSGVNIIQVFGGQRNDVLGEFYRKNKIIK